MPKKRKITYPTGVRPAPSDPQTGETRWSLRWRRDGREHLVLYACDTAGEAAEERRRRIASGTPYGSRGPTCLTIRQAVDLYLPTVPTRATRLQDRSNLRHLVEALGDRSLAGITTPDLRGALDGLRPRSGGVGSRARGVHYDPGSLRAFRRSWCALWSWAVERGHAADNPARDLVVPDGRRARGPGPAPAARKRHLEVEELRALFGWLADPSNAPSVHSMLFRLQFRLGLRISEVCTLREDLLDWATGVWVIDRAISHGEIGPGKKGRRVQKYLSAPARAELEVWLAANPARDGYVLTKARRPCERHVFFDPKQVRPTFNAALAALGGFGLDPRTRTHALRHSWSRIAEHFVGAVGANELSQILGNTPAVAGATYSSGPGPMARAIADHLETVVFGA